MKKILLLLILCLGLVGCSSANYGIFTKEAYEKFTDEERAEIQYQYELLKKRIEANDKPNRTEHIIIKDGRDIEVVAQAMSNMSIEALKLYSNLTSMGIDLLYKSLEGDEDAYSDYIGELIETDDLLTKEAQDELLLKTVTLLNN